MEIAIIIISVVLGLAAIGFIVFLILKQKSAYKPEEQAEEPKKVVYTPKEKPVRTVLTKEQKEEKKQNEHKSKTRRLSELGLKRSHEVNIEEDPNGIEVVGIVYNEKSRVYLFNPKENKLNVGDVVTVLDQSNTKRTVPVVLSNTKVNDEIIIKPFKDILEVVYKTDKKASDYKVEEKKETVTEDNPVEEPVEEAKEEKEPEPEEEVKEAEPEVVEEKAEEPVEEIPVEGPKVEEEPQEAEEPAETEKEVQEEPEEEDQDDSEDEALEQEEEETTDTSESQTSGSVSVEYDEVTKQYKIIKIKRTYECKLSLLSEEVKEYYDNVRNKLLSYDIKYSKTKTCEKFRFNKENIAILKVVGKQVGLYLALDPKELEESKYKGKDLSEKATYKATPFQYKFKTARKAQWANELVEMLAGKLNLEGNPKYKEEAFAKTYKAMTEEELIAKGYMTKTETITNEPPKGFHKVVEIK